MAELIVIEELQAYLVTQGVGQLPGTTPSLTVPSVWTMPRDGAALPRSANGAFVENATITLRDTNLRGPSDLEAWIEEAFIDIIVRARQAGQASSSNARSRGCSSRWTRTAAATSG